MWTNKNNKFLPLPKVASVKGDFLVNERSLFFCIHCLISACILSSKATLRGNVRSKKNGFLDQPLWENIACFKGQNKGLKTRSTLKFSRLPAPPKLGFFYSCEARKASPKKATAKEIVKPIRFVTLMLCSHAVVTSPPCVLYTPLACTRYYRIYAALRGLVRSSFDNSYKRIFYISGSFYTPFSMG